MSEPRATYTPGGITITPPAHTPDQLTAALLWIHTAFAKLQPYEQVEARPILDILDRLVAAALVQAAALEAQKS